MKHLELSMVDLLKKLKKDYGCVELKAEFEAEAVRIQEAMRLKDVAEKAGLGIIIKIGGAEAITDMFEAQHIGVTGLVAPMIESGYAMRKYLEAIDAHFPRDLKKSIVFGVNLETETAFQNLKSILSQKMISQIGKITLGRVDMSASMGLKRDEINCDRMYEVAENMFRAAKDKGFATAMGGGIAVEAIPFITRLVERKLLDYYETRKVVFDAKKALKNAKEGIVFANRFELLWLQNKHNYYERICHEDDARIKMLKTRIKN